MANKVKFGLKNVHYSVITENAGNITYATPVAINGAVSLSIDAQGEINKFYADNIVYYQTSSNDGYSGDLEIANISDDFLKDVLGQQSDSNNVLFESTTDTPKQFALLFEVEGDEKATRHVFYNCVVTRPSTQASTIEEGKKQPQTDKLNLTVSPNINGCIKAKTTSSTTSEDYNNWFSSVYVFSDDAMI